MFKKIYFLLLCVLFSPVLMADTVKLNPEHPGKYVVQKGDTLWDISAKFLQDPWHWKRVWRGNPQIDDPHLIYPGDVISLVFENGQPVLSVSDPVAVLDKISDKPTIRDRNVKLSPKARSLERDDDIQSISIGSIQHFLNRPRIVTEKEMHSWPYVVSTQNESLMSGFGARLYVRGLDEDASETRYALYRRGSPYTNPLKDKNKILGYEAIYLGDVVIEERGDPASAIVVLSKQEILSGDRLVVESDKNVDSEFMLSMPRSDINANILSVVDGVALIGQYQVVVMDVGQADGIKTGNILGIYQSGKIVKDKVATEVREAREDERQALVLSQVKGTLNKKLRQLLNDFMDTKKNFDNSELVQYLGQKNVEPELVKLPVRYAGVLMVFKVFENISYGLIMKAVSPIHVLDSVRNFGDEV